MSLRISIKIPRIWNKFKKKIFKVLEFKINLEKFKVLPTNAIFRYHLFFNAFFLMSKKFLQRYKRQRIIQSVTWHKRIIWRHFIVITLIHGVCFCTHMTYYCYGQKKNYIQLVCYRWRLYHTIFFASFFVSNIIC